MGWYGSGITDGDEPMDYESVINQVCGFDYEKGKREDFVTKEKLEKSQMKIFNKFKKKDTTIIAFQVLAYNMVELGCKFEDVVKEKCIECLEKDEWAKINPERNHCINYLINVLKKYKNIPTSPEDKNLRYDYHKGMDSKYVLYVQSIIKKILAPKKFLKVSEGFGLSGYKKKLIVNIKEDEKSQMEFVKWYQTEDAIFSIFDVGIVYI